MKKAALLLMLVLSSGRCELPPGLAVGDWVYITYSGTQHEEGEIKSISGNWVELIGKDPRYRFISKWHNTLVMWMIQKGDKK
jgi:hypothetical protein